MITRFLLFFCSLSSYALASEGDAQDHLPLFVNNLSEFTEEFGHQISHDINLQGKRQAQSILECGQVYKTYTIDEINGIIGSYVASEELFEEISSQMKFDVQLRRICASCDSILQSKLVDKKMSKDKEFLKYCGENAYGSDTLHSGTVMFPVYLDDDGSHSIIRAKSQLQSWLQFRGLSISNADSTNFWLISQFPATSHLYNQLIAASSGLVSLSFDMTGYGTSNSIVPSPLNRNSIVTASLPILLKARSIILEETGGVSKLGKEAYFAGFSEGGHAAISASDSYKSLGFSPIQVFSGSAPIKFRSEALLGFLRSLRDGNLNNTLQILNILLVGLSMANTREDVANYGSGQYLVAEGIVDDAIAVFSDPSLPSAYLDPAGFSAGVAAISPLIVSTMMSNPLELYGAAIINLFYTALLENDNDPCVNKYEEGVGLYDKACDALDENDLTTVVEQADYNIDICHSLTDELASYNNVPDNFDPSYVTVFTLESGTHGASNLPCGARIIDKLAETHLKNPKLKKPKKNKNHKKTKKSKKPKKSKKTKKPKEKHF